VREDDTPGAALAGPGGRPQAFLPRLKAAEAVGLAAQLRTALAFVERFFSFAKGYGDADLRPLAAVVGIWDSRTLPPLQLLLGRTYPPRPMQWAPAVAGRAWMRRSAPTRWMHDAHSRPPDGMKSARPPRAATSGRRCRCSRCRASRVGCRTPYRRQRGRGQLQRRLRQCCSRQATRNTRNAPPALADEGLPMAAASLAVAAATAPSAAQHATATHMAAASSGGRH